MLVSSIVMPATMSLICVALLGRGNSFPMLWEIHVQQWEEGKAYLKCVFFIWQLLYFFAWACKIKIHWVVMTVIAFIKHLFSYFPSYGLIFEEKQSGVIPLVPLSLYYSMAFSLFQTALLAIHFSNIECII